MSNSQQGISNVEVGRERGSVRFCPSFAKATAGRQDDGELCRVGICAARGRGEGGPRITRIARMGREGSGRGAARGVVEDWRERCGQRI